jgi:hypothetical protein
VGGARQHRLDLAARLFAQGVFCADADADVAISVPTRIVTTPGVSRFAPTRSTS